VNRPDGTPRYGLVRAYCATCREESTEDCTDQCPFYGMTPGTSLDLIEAAIVKECRRCRTAGVSCSLDHEDCSLAAYRLRREGEPPLVPCERPATQTRGRVSPADRYRALGVEMVRATQDPDIEKWLRVIRRHGPAVVSASLARLRTAADVKNRSAYFMKIIQIESERRCAPKIKPGVTAPGSLFSR
jgi:hypothetical protein